MKKILLTPFLLFSAFTFAHSAIAQGANFLVDAVVASVNGKPITLQEVLKRLPSKRTLSLSTAAGDQEAKNVLEALINERLIEEDASVRRVGVSDAEINSYVDEVAKRNQMSREAFQEALTNEGHAIDEYNAKVRLDIMRSKIASQFVQGGVTVTQDEIKAFLENQSVTQNPGKKIKLSQIFLSTQKRTQEEFDALYKLVNSRLEAGEDFSVIATENSDGAEAKNGGSLGEVAEQDLSPEIFNVLSGLKAGEVSIPLSISAGILIFRVENRFQEEQPEVDEDTMKGARDQLRQQKIQSKMETYFTTELPKLYPVERKI